MLDASRLPSTGARPYNDASPFNQTLADLDAKALPSSAATAQKLVSGGLDSRCTFTAGALTSAADYSHPVYLGEVSDPAYTVKVTEKWGTSPATALKVHIPTGAKPAAGSDHHLTILDQPSGKEFDFWGVKTIASGVITAQWATVLDIAGDGVAPKPAACAGAVGLRAGIITAEELRAGEIPHALFAVVPYTFGFTAPAKGKARERGDTSDPANGQRFCLDYSPEAISEMRLPVWQEAIVRALSEYGFIVSDTGGGFFKCESSQPYNAAGVADPLVDLAKELGIKPGTGSYAGTYTYRFNSVIDWSRLRAVA